MVARLFAKFFWDIYDLLGRAILINLICFSAALPIIALPRFFPAAIYLSPLFIILLSGLFAASLYFFSRISDDHEPSLYDFFAGVKKFSVRAFVISFLFLATLAILGYYIYFYLNPRIIPAGVLRIGATMIAGLCFWAIVFLLLMMVHAFPLLVVQNPPLKVIMSRAALLVLDNLLFSLVVLVMLVGLWLLGIMLYVGPAIFSFSCSAALLMSSFDTIMQKYERRAKQSGGRGEEGASAADSAEKPKSWKEIKRDDVAAKPDRYKRGLRDIFKPWEY